MSSDFDFTKKEIAMVVVKIISIIVFVIIIAGSLGFISDSVGLMSYKFFAPRVEQVRHDTFKQSQAYNDGMAQELDQMYKEYQVATDSQKTAIQQIAMHRASNYPVEKLPVYLQGWLRELRSVTKY